MNGLEVLVSWLTPTVLFCILNLMIIIFILNSNKKQPDSIHHPSQLVRIPSLFERVKSFNISMYRADPQPDPVHHTTLAIAHEEPVHQHGEEIVTHVTRSKSDTILKEMKLDARMLKKSASEKLVVEADGEKEVMVDRRRPATVRERTSLIHGEDEAVDEKADDFINRFRQQLKLQRLDSIARYKEMLNRGMGR